VQGHIDQQHALDEDENQQWQQSLAVQPSHPNWRILGWRRHRRLREDFFIDPKGNQPSAA
jgi:hypothetical protein